MYQFGVRLNVSRERVVQQYLEQHSRRPQVNRKSLDSAIPFPQFFLFESRVSRVGAFALLMGCTIATLSGCGGVVYGNSDFSGTSAALNQISCGTPSLIGPQTKACSVSLSTPAASPTVVTLASSDSGVLSLPASVTVATGANTAGFNAVSSPVTVSSEVTISGSARGHKKTAVITVYPIPTTPSTLSRISCSSQTVTGPVTEGCTVYLNSATTTPTVVTLTSSNSALSVPGSVTVAAGAQSAGFTATASAVTSPETATLTATLNGTSQTDAIQLEAPAASTPSTSPALSASVTSLTFGNVSVGTAVTQSVTLTSSGTAPVTLNSDSISGTGFSVKGGNFPATLNPGQAAVLTVQFSPTTASSVTGSLTLSSNGPAVAVSLSGTGTAVAPTVSAISCNSTSITGALGDSCTVSLSGSAPSGGTVVTLASSSGAASVPNAVTVPATGTSATFTATVASVTSAQSATLTATTGSTSRTVTLQLNAGTPGLTVNATSVAFGDVVINNATTQTVTLTSSGTAAVTVNSIAVAGSGFSASPVSVPATLNPGQTLSVTLTFDPTAVGATSGQLTITSTASTNPTVTIGLSGTGDPHQVDLSWVAPTGSSVPITGYNVYRAASGTGAFALLNSGGTQTTYADTTVQATQSYDYIVKSVDSTGTESAPSNTTTVTVP